MKYQNLLEEFINTTLILSPTQKTSLKRETIQSFAYNYIKEHIYFSISNVATDFMIKVLQISQFKEKRIAELKRRLKYRFSYIIRNMVKEELLIKYGQKCYKVK